MGRAREEFVQRLNSFASVLDQPFIIDQGIDQELHNERARILRNGLSVMGFTILEDFIRRRISEATSFLAAVDIDFDELPEKMRNSLTRDALSAVLQIEKTGFSDPEDKVRFIQEEAKVVGSTRNEVRAFSEYAFGWTASNVNDDQVSKALNSFGVDGAWEQVNLFMQRVGAGVLDAKTEFKNAAERRHKAAHRANANTQPTELSNFSDAAKGLALGVDALLSECLRRFQIKDRSFLGGWSKVTSKDISVVYIKERSKNDIAEVRENAVRATKRYKNLSDAVNTVYSKHASKGRFCVILDKRDRVKDWVSHEQ